MAASAWILISNKGSKAQTIKDLVMDIFTNFKDLFDNLLKLYTAIEEFIKEVTGQFNQDNQVKPISEESLSDAAQRNPEVVQLESEDEKSELSAIKKTSFED